MLHLTTGGESHGSGITAVLSGVPFGLEISTDAINAELARRQLGYGRGGRMAIEKDTAEIFAGVRLSTSTGAPIVMLIHNSDSRLNDTDATPELYAPRPGHADLAGHLATGAPIRDVLERASARETAARVAGGAVAKQLLSEFGIEICSHVTTLGEVTTDAKTPTDIIAFDTIDDSPVRCLDEAATEQMTEQIDKAKELGESLGGVFEVVAFGVPVGLGRNTELENRLDARLAAALMSIPAIKGVEIGEAFENAMRLGSKVHDEIVADKDHALGGGYARSTNRAGGIEGGISSGMPVVVRAAMKPIPTLMTPLKSVDLRTGEEVDAAKERSDVCALPAAAVVGEAMMAITIAAALLERLGSGGLSELKARYQDTHERINQSNVSS